MSGSVFSPEFPCISPEQIRSNIRLEQIRSNHEEIEIMERLVMKVLQSNETSPVKQLLQGHRLRALTTSIIMKTDQLVKTYETKAVAEIEADIPPIGHGQTTTTCVSSAFFRRLEKILEYHRMLPSQRLLNLGDKALLDEEEEPLIAFTTEEGFGRYLDLHHTYSQYINSDFGRKVEYSAYLDEFSHHLENIPPTLKLSRQYTTYVEALLEYLINFFLRTEPLQDLDRILAKVEADLRELKVGVHLSLPLICSVSVELDEAKVRKLCSLLDETIKRTKQQVEKRQALALEAHTESESGCDHNSPNRAMGWDGKPIPYWLCRLGLGQEYKCEICGNESYAGKRAFERHFKEWRHQLELRRLGITSTGEEMNGITLIEELRRLGITSTGEEMNGITLIEELPGERRMLKRQTPLVQSADDEIKEKKSSSQVPAGVAIPPPDIRSVVMRIARILSIKDMEFERKVMEICERRPLFKFLNSSDLYHEYFLYKLGKYRAQFQKDPALATERVRTGSAITYSDYADSVTFPPAEFMVPPALQGAHKFGCKLPNCGITREELDVLKLTAQFWGRYGKCFWDGGVGEKVGKDPLFKFMNPKDCRFGLFVRLVEEYSEILRSWETLKEEVRKNAADVETVLENCHHRVQWDGFTTEYWKKASEKKGRKVTKYDEAFANIVVLRDLALCPPKPDPNTPKIDESELVPEDEFLAQQPPGCTTIWVNIPEAGDAYAEVRVDSLSETVGTLKEKIHESLKLAVSRQKISGKTGLLEDHKSLAYYNVGATDTLTMSLLARVPG